MFPIRVCDPPGRKTMLSWLQNTYLVLRQPYLQILGFPPLEKYIKTINKEQIEFKTIDQSSLLRNIKNPSIIKLNIMYGFFHNCFSSTFSSLEQYRFLYEFLKKYINIELVSFIDNHACLICISFLLLNLLSAQELKP